MSSNLARKTARNKKQTRLTFDPVDSSPRSSSPANMSPAKVRYQLPNLRNTPSSTRPSYADNGGDEDGDELGVSTNGISSMSRTAKGKGKQKKNGKLPFKSLPTPVKSSQVPKGMSDLEIESDGDNQQDPPYASLQSKPLFSSVSRRGRKPVNLDDSDGSLPEEEVQTPSKKPKGKKAVFPTPDHESEEEADSVSIRAKGPAAASESALKPRPIAKGRRQEYVKLSSASDDELFLPNSKKSNKRKAAKSFQNRLPEEDDEDDDIKPASSGRKPRSSQKSNERTINIDSDSDDELIRSSLPEHRAAISTPEGAEDESDEEPITSPMKGRKRGRVEADLDISGRPSSPRMRWRPIQEDENEDSDLPPVSKISSKGKGKVAPASSRIKFSPTRTTRQSVVRKHRTAKEKQMELLKRKRAGENIDELTDSSMSSESKRGAYDTDSAMEMLSNFEDESESEEAEKPRKRVNNNSYELPEFSDFIVDDDEATLGVPLGLMDIPLKFRHAAHKPIKEHFKDAVEWLVHRKINPAFSRNDEVYLQAFRKLDDEYQGYAKSKFASSQWTAEFTRVLYARPIFIERGCGEGEGYTLDGVPKCDVCNHRKHFPKFAIHFQGKAYHKTTLEEIEQDSEEDSDDSDDAQSVDSKGYVLPSEDKEWFSGRFCFNNAQQAHTLIHWKYHLNTWVEAQLETEGYLTPDKLAEREKMKAKQRRNYANNLVDGWENGNIIKDLYRDFKSQLETARESNQGRWERGQYKGVGGGAE